MQSLLQGKIGEYGAAIDLIGQGLRVFTAFDPGESYDLIAVTSDNRFYRVEVKFSQSGKSMRALTKREKVNADIRCHVTPTTVRYSGGGSTFTPSFHEAVERATLSR